MNNISRLKITIESRTLIFVLLLLFPLVLFVSSTKTANSSVTWTVDRNGTGLRLIQQAIDIAEDGDTILVMSGIYEERLTVDKTLSILGQDPNNTIIDGGNTGDVITVAASEVTIRGFTIQHGIVGVRLAGGAEENTLSDNHILSNDFYGIYGDLSGEAIITDNEISFNGWHGIFLYGSKPCIIEDNQILSNQIDGMFLRASNNNTIVGNILSDNGVCGIHIYSDEDPIRAHGLSRNNVIRNNQISENPCGIKIEYIGTDVSSASNDICQNSIAYNNLGLNVSGSNGNSIYHNNFINNSEQLFILQSFNNNWNGSYYFGGNYWSDKNETDTYWGRSQNETGSDGITDIPYLVSPDTDEKDGYPFTQVNGWLPSPEMTMTFPLNRTYGSRVLQLTLTVNKPVCLTYSLDSQPNVTLSGNVLLNDLTVGPHIVTVYANDSLGNEASSRTAFTVTFLGDINLDGTVNIIDISMVAFAYGCSPESERWNPAADLDKNGIINVLDLALVAKDYGNRV